MFKALLLSQFLLAVVSHAKVDLPAEWHLWKSQHGRSYETEDEELRRHVIWQSNKKYIDEHNKYSDAFGYTLGMNHFGDLVRRNSSTHLNCEMQ